MAVVVVVVDVVVFVVFMDVVVDVAIDRCRSFPIVSILAIVVAAGSAVALDLYSRLAGLLAEASPERTTTSPVESDS